MREGQPWSRRVPDGAGGRRWAPPSRRTSAVVTALVLLVLLAPRAVLLVHRQQCEAPARFGGFEDGFDAWDRGPNVLPDPGASVVLDRSPAYEGDTSARATIPAGSGNKYARTLWVGSSGEGLQLGEGDEFSYGMALHLPEGFHEDVPPYFSPVRWDNFGVENPSRSGLAMYGDGRMRLFREREGREDQVNLLGSTTFRLSEGEWHWLEVRQRLSATDGRALNELRVDDRLIGTSTTRNYYGEPVSALRFGIVAISASSTPRLSLHYDGAALSRERIRC